MLIFVDRYGFFDDAILVKKWHNKVETGATVSMEIKTTSLLFELRHERTVSMNIIGISRYLVSRFPF